MQLTCGFTSLPKEVQAQVLQHVELIDVYKWVVEYGANLSGFVCWLMDKDQLSYNSRCPCSVKYVKNKVRSLNWVSRMISSYQVFIISSLKFMKDLQTVSYPLGYLKNTKIALLFDKSTIVHSYIPKLLELSDNPLLFVFDDIAEASIGGYRSYTGMEEYDFLLDTFLDHQYYFPSLRRWEERQFEIWRTELPFVKKFLFSAPLHSLSIIAATHQRLIGHMESISIESASDLQELKISLSTYVTYSDIGHLGPLLASVYFRSHYIPRTLKKLYYSHTSPSDHAILKFQDIEFPVLEVLSIISVDFSQKYEAKVQMGNITARNLKYFLLKVPDITVVDKMIVGALDFGSISIDTVELKIMDTDRCTRWSFNFKICSRPLLNVIKKARTLLLKGVGFHNFPLSKTDEVDDYSFPVLNFVSITDMSFNEVVLEDGFNINSELSLPKLEKVEIVVSTGLSFLPFMVEPTIKTMHKPYIKFKGFKNSNNLKELNITLHDKCFTTLPNKKRCLEFVVDNGNTEWSKNIQVLKVNYALLTNLEQNKVDLRSLKTLHLTNTFSRVDLKEAKDELSTESHDDSIWVVDLPEIRTENFATVKYLVEITTKSRDKFYLRFEATTPYYRSNVEVTVIET